MNRIESVVFDFDGTLAELTIDFTLMRRQVGALAEAFLEKRCQPEAEPVLEWIETLTRRIEKRDSEAGREFASRCRLLVTAMELESARNGRLFPFARRLLEELSDRGLKRGIITRNCSAAVKKVFPDLDSYCDVFLAREDVGLVKPHPDHLLRAVRALKVEPAGCLMVGDHAMDIQVAKHAGTRCAGVVSGKMSRSQLEAECPDFLFDRADELLGLL